MPSCNCSRVEDILGDVQELKDKVQKLEEERASRGDHSDGDYDGAVGRPQRARAQPLPLQLGEFGQLYDANARLFDDKLANDAAFSYNGLERWYGL